LAHTTPKSERVLQGRKTVSRVVWQGLFQLLKEQTAVKNFLGDLGL
jgi:hypothetical protein